MNYDIKHRRLCRGEARRKSRKRLYHSAFGNPYINVRYSNCKYSKDDYFYKEYCHKINAKAPEYFKEL